MWVILEIRAMISTVANAITGEYVAASICRSRADIIGVPFLDFVAYQLEPGPARGELSSPRRSNHPGEVARAGWAPARSRQAAATSQGTGSGAASGLLIETAQTAAPMMNNVALT